MAAPAAERRGEERIGVSGGRFALILPRVPQGRRRGEERRGDGVEAT